MAERRISIRITIDNRDALNAAKAQAVAMRSMGEETQRQTHLQAGLTSSFIKGNLAARAISATYLSLRDSLRFAVSEAINFEHNLTKISAITGATGGVLTSLEKSIRGVAVATNQSQNEIARAALEMGKIGLSGKQVEDALGGVAALARALDEDVVKSGETVVAVLNTYGIEARNADMVTNQLAFTVKASAIDIESFATAFSYVGGTAAAAGVDLAELQAAMDVLSNSGIKASTIGTQLRRIIADLSNENSDAAAVLGGKTLSSYNSFADALQALADKNLSISDYTTIFGRTASSVAAILTKYTGNIRELTEATKASEGALAPMTALMNTTLKSNIDGIKTAWAELTIEFSKSTGPLTKLVGLLKEGILGFAEDFKANKQVAAFRKQDPSGFMTARDEIIEWQKSGRIKDDLPTNDRVIQTAAFERFKFAISDREWIDKTKANIQQEIMDILDKDFAKQVAEGKGKVSDIPFAKGSEHRREVLEKMFGGELYKFYNAIPGAQAKLAQQLESRKLESGLPEGFGKKKKGHEKVEHYGIWAYGQTLGPRFLEKEAKLNEKEDAEAAKKEEEAAGSMAAFAEKHGRLQDTFKDRTKWLEDSAAGMTALKMSTDAVNGSLDIFSTYLVDGIFSSKEDPFKGISDAFGNFAKKMAADIVSLLIKVSIFKGLLMSLSLIPGAGGAVPFVSALATASTGMKFASGTDQIVRTPTAFVAGDGGAERVKVTPRAKMGSSDEGGGMTIVIQGDVHDYDRFARKVKEAQGSNRRNFV